MLARIVSVHLKSNMLSDYLRSFEEDILPYFTSRGGSRTKSDCQIPAVQMWLRSVCGRAKPMHKPTTTILTRKC